MRILNLMVAASLVCCLLVTSASAQSSKKKDTDFDFTKGPGIEIGAEFPDIKLKNQDGDEVSIHKLLESNNVAIVFYRSADW